MKRPQRLSEARGKADRTTSGGPIRRRRAQRHLDNLATFPERVPSPTAGVAHVRVIGQSDPPVDTGQNSTAAWPVAMEEGASDQNAHRVVSRSIRALPIDEPFGAPFHPGGR